jgi:ribonuclease H
VSKWRLGWKKRGWTKADKKPIKNLELIQEIDRAMEGRRVTFEWVKGHAGHRMNERADDLARACAEAYQAGRTPEPGPGFGGGASGSRGSASAGQEPGRATSASAAPASVEPHDEATISDAPTNASRDDAADESTTSTFRSHPSVFSAPTEASEPAEAAPTSSVSTPTIEDALAREREFILAWTGGDERALATMTDERTTRIWPGGGATTTLGGPSPVSPSIGRIDVHDVGGAFLARYRVRWEGGTSLESSVWAPATSGEARLVMVHHQSTLIG